MRMSTVATTRVCKVCQGTGKVVKYLMVDGDSIMGPCNLCAGTGTVIVEPGKLPRAPG